MSSVFSLGDIVPRFFFQDQGASCFNENQSALSFRLVCTAWAQDFLPIFFNSLKKKIESDAVQKEIELIPREISFDTPLTPSQESLLAFKALKRTIVKECDVLGTRYLLPNTPFFHALQLDAFYERQQAAKEKAWKMIWPHLRKELVEEKFFKSQFTESEALRSKLPLPEAEAEQILKFLEDPEVRAILSKCGNLQLELSNIGLEMVPYEISYFKIGGLRLQYNKISQFPNFEKCPDFKIVMLNLGRNQIITFPNLACCTYSVGLEWNRIEVLPTTASWTKRLQLIDLHQNLIETIPEGFALGPVQEINISHNLLPRRPVFAGSHSFTAAGTISDYECRTDLARLCRAALRAELKEANELFKKLPHAQKSAILEEMRMLEGAEFTDSVELQRALKSMLLTKFQGLTDQLKLDIRDRVNRYFCGRRQNLDSDPVRMQKRIERHLPLLADIVW